MTADVARALERLEHEVVLWQGEVEPEPFGHDQVRDLALVLPLCRAALAADAALPEGFATLHVLRWVDGRGACAECRTDWPCTAGLLERNERQAREIAAVEAALRTSVDRAERFEQEARTFEAQATRNGNLAKAADRRAELSDYFRHCYEKVLGQVKPLEAALSAAHAPPEYAAWRDAVRATEAMVNASVEYEEAIRHIAACRVAEREALAALRAAVVRETGG